MICAKILKLATVGHCKFFHFPFPQLLIFVGLKFIYIKIFSSTPFARKVGQPRTDKIFTYYAH